MRYVVEIENAPDITVYQYRGAGCTYSDVKKINPQPLPAYVSELAVQNSELSETVSQYKDFVTSICHALGVSLSLTQGEIINEIHRLKRRFSEVEKELLFTVEKLESVKAIENDRRVGLLQDNGRLKHELELATEWEAAGKRQLELRFEELRKVTDKLAEAYKESEELYKKLEDKEELLQAAVEDCDRYRELYKEYRSATIKLGNDLLAVREKLKEVEAEANDLEAENAKLKDQEASLRLELLSTRSNRDLWRCEWHQAVRKLAALEAANAALVKERNDALEIIEKCQH